MQKRTNRIVLDLKEVRRLNSQKRHIQHLSKRTAHQLRMFKGSSYTKIRFDCSLSDYQRNIVLKIVEYAKAFEATADDIKYRWHVFQLPVPSVPSTFEELLKEFSDNHYFCLQDDTGKRYVDYMHHRCHAPWLYMNQHIMVVDNLIASYRQQTSHSLDEIQQLSYNIITSLQQINSSIFNFNLHTAFESNHEPTLEEATNFYPNQRYFSDSRALHKMVCTIVSMIQHTTKFPSEKQYALYYLLLQERQLCFFSSLCGLMLDSFVGTEDFFKPLCHIESFMRMVFHDASLYRLELPKSPVNTLLPIGSRGSSAHTTIMKLFLFDRYGNRVFIRIDLPHVLTLTFHFNVESPDTQRYKKYDHHEIVSEQKNDELIPVLDILKESILQQMPNSCVIADTDSKVEDKILKEMKKYTE